MERRPRILSLLSLLSCPSLRAKSSTAPGMAAHPHHLQQAGASSPMPAVMPPPLQYGHAAQQQASTRDLLFSRRAAVVTRRLRFQSICACWCGPDELRSPRGAAGRAERAWEFDFDWGVCSSSRLRHKCSRSITSKFKSSSCKHSGSRKSRRWNKLAVWFTCRVQGCCLLAGYC